jgi:hypothetical protein
MFQFFLPILKLLSPFLLVDVNFIALDVAIISCVM